MQTNELQMLRSRTPVGFKLKFGHWSHALIRLLLLLYIILLPFSENVIIHFYLKGFPYPAELSLLSWSDRRWPTNVVSMACLGIQCARG